MGVFGTGGPVVDQGVDAPEKWRGVGLAIHGKGLRAERSDVSASSSWCFGSASSQALEAHPLPPETGVIETIGLTRSNCFVPPALRRVKISSGVLIGADSSFTWFVTQKRLRNFPVLIPGPIERLQRTPNFPGVLCRRRLSMRRASSLRASRRVRAHLSAPETGASLSRRPVTRNTRTRRLLSEVGSLSRGRAA